MASIITKAPPKPRPMYLNLVQIRLPLPGILSIMHRISGAVLFLCLPVLLWLLDRSLDTEIGYDFVRQVVLANWMVKVVLAGLLWGFMHHFCAGIRYLFLDMHQGIDLKSARRTAAAVYFVSIPLTLVAAWLLLF
jgi:succinate dehydrogenase / fumarate reductase cytochrome b subunit